jgi:hypothetical protein
MRSRFAHVLEGHSISVGRGGISARLSTLRHLVTDRLNDAERAYRSALLDLRHGLDVVRVLREVARLEELFALIRWCDDWLVARRTLVARVEAQLDWFADQAFEDRFPSEDATAEDSTGAPHEDPSAWPRS